MDTDFLQIALNVAGGLGIFLLGMKHMSEGLQAVSGDRLRKIISVATNNRFLGVLMGMLVTMLVQSSSVTTVMVVGFVNSAIMNLMQAIGVILGANIGTTVTGWILVLNIGKWGLPILGISAFFFLFSKNERLRYVGMTIMGIGMVLIVAAVLCAAIVIGFGILMPARTVKGARAQEEVLGFEEFLQRVESDRFRRMITGPEMFEKYLPYAMALGVEKQWAAAFADILREPPNWYHGPGYATFRPATLVSDLSGMSTATASAMTTAPRSTGGSGMSGGGGFSGGGFGGGGGGAF